MIVTDNRSHAIEELNKRVPSAAPRDLANTPFLLIGTLEQMAAQLARQANELGINSYVVREPELESIEQLLPLLDDQ